MKTHKSLNKVNLYLKFTIFRNKIGIKMTIRVAD